MELNILLDQWIPASDIFPSHLTVISCLVLSMLITTAEPPFLVPGLDSGCALPGSDPPFTAVELVSVLGVAVLGPAFGVAGLALVGPPVNSDCAGALAVPVALESEPVCAVAGKASITTKKGTKQQKCLREVSTHMSCPPRCAETNTFNISFNAVGFFQADWVNAVRPR